VSRRGWLLFGFMCVIWGIPYLLIRVAVREVTPGMLVFLRTALSAAALLPIAARRGELRNLLPHWRPILAFTTIEIAIPWLALFSAERRVSSSLAALLIAATPFVSAAIAVLTGGERLGSRRLAGLVVGLAGVAAIVGLDVEHTSGIGLAELAVVAVCYATGPWILDRYLRDVPSLGAIAVSLAATATVYVPVAALQIPSSVPSTNGLLSIAALALVCTALGFVCFVELIAEVGPVRATVFTYVNPAVAAVLGVVILNERFTAGMGVGFVLVLAGSFLATSAARDAPQPVVVEP
jgi:drug/metabolite transporter (DMT)-like permease